LGKKDPLSPDEQAQIGGMLAHVLGAMKGGAGASRDASCQSLFPDGEPPSNADKDATWQACKDLVYVPSHRHHGASLTALYSSAPTLVKAPGSVVHSLAAFYAPPTEAVHAIAKKSNEDTIVETTKNSKDAAAKGEAKSAAEMKRPPYDEEGFKGDWHNEWRNDEYPEDSKGKWHHPDFNGQPKRMESGAPSRSNMVGSSLVFASVLALAFAH